MRKKVAQKYEVSLLSFLLMLILINCTNMNLSNLNQPNSLNQQANLLIGKWKVESVYNMVNVEDIDDKYFNSNTDSMNLFIFFGPTAWHFSIGKYFQFKEDGELETNMLSEKQTELMNFKYKNDKKLIIYTVPKIKGDSINTYTDIISLNEEEMVLELDGMLRVTLVKTL